MSEDETEPQLKNYRVRLNLSGYVEAENEEQACEVAMQDIESFELVDWEARELK